jgi:Phage major capsid protein E.
MNYDPNYEPRTLLEPFLEGPLVHTFLRDTFFGAREYPPTNMVEFDFRRGRRKMAPFVAPLIGGKVMERQGYETRFFRAPRIAPVRALRTPDLEPRLPGETIYSGELPQIAPPS